jgi:hypothetical protein
MEASQTTCPVVNYDKDGKLTSFMTLQCVKEGDACPCGKNTISCPDPNDVAQRDPNSWTQSFLSFSRLIQMVADK